MSTTLTAPLKEAIINPNIQQNAVGLKQNLNKSQADSVVVQMYLTAILQQPDIVQNIVPDLPKIQAEAELWLRLGMLMFYLKQLRLLLISLASSSVECL